MKVYSIAILLFAVAFHSTAFAQDDVGDENDGEVEPSGQTSDAAARGRFQAGLAFYEDARYEEALPEFEAAWDLSRRPEMLFNVANAAERSFDHTRAASALEEYLELVPDADDEDLLRRRIERNRAAADGDSSGSSLRLAGWLTIGGAGALGVASLITGLVSHSTHSDLEENCMPTCSADRQGDIDSGRRLATVSTVLSGIALAAGIAGIVLVIVGGGDGEDDDAASTEVAVLPSIGGASVRVRY